MQSKKALKLMRSGVPVNVEYISCDIKRKTGGKLKYLSNAVHCGASHNKKKHATIVMREFPDGGPTTIHTSLIQKVNDQFVN